MRDVKLYAPESYWEADPKVRAVVTGGCGPGKLGDWLVPDTLYGLSVRPACEIHDWMYAVGDTLSDKEEADRVFLNNMCRIIDANTSWGFLRWLRKRRAKKYYYAVKLFGGTSFWNDKNESRNFRQLSVLEEWV